MDTISAFVDFYTLKSFENENNNIKRFRVSDMQKLNFNHLNLPVQITWSSTKKINYLYNAAGQKLKKTVVDGSTTKTTEYLDGFQYENNLLEFFPTSEGYVKATPMSPNPADPQYSYNYVYNYTDHLGNVRISYAKDPQTGDLKVMEENNYYPYGLKHASYASSVSLSFQKQLDDWGVMLAPVTNNPYKYKYNGKELQDELGLNMYDYGARNYNPALGRWMNIDPLAETNRRNSPYVYALNNPVFFIDPDGMEGEASSDSSSSEAGTGAEAGEGFNPVYGTDGSFLGTDDQGLQGKAFVMDKSDFKQGMSHEEAESKNLGSDGLKNVEAAQKLVDHYDTLSSRPDYDGFVTVQEGIDWAKGHPNLDNDGNESNGMGNATPNDWLYLDASKMNFGTLTTADLELNKVITRNLLYETSLLNSKSIATSYALGQTKIKLLNKNGAIQVVNGNHNIYNWDRGGGAIRRGLISAERARTGINDSHGFPLYIYGTGHVQVFKPLEFKE